MGFAVFVIAPFIIAYGVKQAEIYWPEATVYSVLWLAIIGTTFFSDRAGVHLALVAMIVVVVVMVVRIWGWSFLSQRI
jgi:hypothetical protein